LLNYSLLRSARFGGYFYSGPQRVTKEKAFPMRKKRIPQYFTDFLIKKSPFLPRYTEGSLFFKKNKKFKKMTTSFSALIDSETPVLVDFSAEWCGPCKMLAPVLKEVKGRIGDAARIVKIDIDANEQIAGFYHVRSVPTMILFKKGEIIWRESGLMTAQQLENALRPHI
jgi:thioredoxin 1